MATTAPRQPKVPPAVEATGEIGIWIGAWWRSHADMEAKALVHDRLRNMGMDDALAYAWGFYESARQWEADRWDRLKDVVPCNTRASYRLGDVVVYYTRVDRSGLSLRAEKGGELIRR